MMKKAVSAILASALLLVVVACPAFASSWTTNGYAVKTVYYNGYPYDASLGFGYNANSGAYLEASCQAAIGVNINTLTVKYLTKNYGYVTNSGGEKIGAFSQYTHTIRGGYVPCGVGMSQVVRWVYANGNAYFRGDTTVTVPVVAQQP